MKFCDDKMVQIKDTMKLLHEVKSYPAQELNFFSETAASIRTCRRVLKYTYVIRFFNENPKSKTDPGFLKLFNY